MADGGWPGAAGFATQVENSSGYSVGRDGALHRPRERTTIDGRRSAASLPGAKEGKV